MSVSARPAGPPETAKAIRHRPGRSVRIFLVQTDDRLRGILALVEESLDEPALSGDDLAGRAYLSRFHFDRLVAAAVGEPPGSVGACCWNGRPTGWSPVPSR